jgi:hypothetical protein
MLRLLLVFVLIPMTLVGCGKSQTPEQKVQDGNAKIARMNEISRSVGSAYGITLASSLSESTVSSENDFMIDRLTPAQLRDLQAQAQEFRSLAGDVINIINSGDVTYGDRSTLDRAARTADNVLALLP